MPPKHSVHSGASRWKAGAGPGTQPRWMGLLSLTRRRKAAFQDNNFPLTVQSLAVTADKRGTVTWRRVADICATQDVQPHLFKGLPAPSHIRQGLLGDCWLLCALACLSCKPGALERCFRRQEVSREGCYTVRLFDCRQNRWTKVVIDDWLPCDELTGKLVYARTVDGSVWVPLLEKAMAKFCGCSYSALHGGNTAWALATLTGVPCFKFRYDAPSGRWRRHELVYTCDSSGPTFRLAKTGCYIDTSAIFRLLVRLRGGGAMIAASSGKSRLALDPQSGIRPGHAYAVISVIAAHGCRLLRLWVPAGEKQWQDGWHPRRSTWDVHPELAHTMKGSNADGTFWLTWNDFCHYFHTLEICAKEDS